jgi:hypothetical protein
VAANHGIEAEKASTGGLIEERCGCGFLASWDVWLCYWMACLFRGMEFERVFDAGCFRDGRGKWYPGPVPS